MAKKSTMKKELKKMQELVGGDTKLTEVLKQINEVSKNAQSVQTENTRRLRTPYVDAVPLNSACWAK